MGFGICWAKGYIIDGSGLKNLRSIDTDMDTDTGIRYDEIQGHNKFQKSRTQIRQGHDIIK